MVIENKTIFNNNFEMGFVIFLIISNISIYYLSFNDNIQLIEYLYGNVNIVYIFAVISILNSFLFFLIKSNYYLNLSIPFFIYLLFFMSIIFGRGNQQISPKIIKMVGKENIIVLATNNKLMSIGTGQPLLVDTGDIEVDRMLSGYTRVITGYNEEVVLNVSN